MRLVFFVVMIFVSFLSSEHPLQSDGSLDINVSVQEGMVLQGIVPIQGTIQANQIRNYEISFSYADDTSETWFLIEEGANPVQDGLIATWDTTLITDGDYRLRVLVTLSNGVSEEYLVPDIKVRNYLPVEPLYEADLQPAFTITPTDISVVSTPTNVVMTSTPFAPNPGSLNKDNFGKILIAGASISGATLFLLGLYLSIFTRRRKR